MRVVTGTHRDVTGHAIAKWYMDRTGLQFETSFSAIGFTDLQGALTTVAIFFDYNGYNIEIAYFGKLTKQRIKLIAKHVFDHLGCGRITIKVRRKDHGETYPDLYKIGFDKESCLEKFFGPDYEDDAIIYRMLKDECLIPQWVYNNGESSKGI